MITLLSYNGKSRLVMLIRLRLKTRENKGSHRKGCKTNIALAKISLSRDSVPIGATKNNWNRNFRRAMMTIITMMIMIM